jgi:hypothetical protein
VKKLVRQGDRVVSVTTQDDLTWPVDTALEKPEALEISSVKPVWPLEYKSVSVLLGEVKKAYARQLNPAKMLEMALVIGASAIILDQFFGFLGSLFWALGYDLAP